MATNEDNGESDLENNQFPLLIIHEDDVDHICPESQREPLTDYVSSWHGDRGGRARGNRRSAGRAGLEQRRRGRGLIHKTAERTSFEDWEDNENNVSGRGRGRARDRRPYRGRARGSRHQSADRQDESADKRNVDRGNSNRGRVNVKSNINMSERTNPMHQYTFDNNEQADTLAKGERIHKLSESKLIALSKSKDEPDALLLEVSKMSTGFINILQKQLDPNSVYFVVRILSIISRSSQNAHLRNILREVDSHMLTNLTNLLYEISMKDHKFESLWSVPNNIENFLVNIVAVTKVVMTILSPSLGKCCSLITAIRTVKQKLSLESIESELECIETLFEKVKENKELNERKQKKFHSGTEGSTEPPNSFREIPIFPELIDLTMDERPFLRANKVHGKYDNLDTYLDVQFRLLREDYIQPLRKGISEYRDCIKSGGNVKKIRELKLYHSVKIMYPVCSGKGIDHVIQFDTSPFKHMKWASSRRLLHGSLLCLSNDNFDTILYATVTGRDELQLKDGKLEVHFENTDNLFAKQMNKVFIMAETSAYFEAYRFILEGLQEIESNMPFERYLVNCETTVKPPGYLLSAGGPHYDFTNLLLRQCDSVHFPVLNTRDWPKAIDLGLDSSQYEALQRAITKELAIIQGPPGTGKTFVGLKIAELLLDNQSVWKKKEKSTQLLLGRRKISRKIEGSPILVVCYTNHALDQFLEGLVTMGKDKVVRIGGRCKNEAIEKYVLRNVKRQRKENREWSYGLSENDAHCRKVLKECEEKIELSNTQMKKSETGILPYITLMRFMTEAQQDAFESSHTEDELKTCLSKWLGFNETPEKAINLSHDRQIQMTWQEFIVKEISPMHDSDRQYNSDIFSLQLIQRAELYKAWVAELVKNIHKPTLPEQSEKGQVLNSNELNTILYQAESTILEAGLLIRYASRHDTRKQLMLLLDMNTKGTNNPIWHWLCLSQSISKIKAVLEDNFDTQGKSNDSDGDGTVETDDMEEDRELDEEEHFFAMEKKFRGTKTSVEKNDGEWLSIWNKRSFSKKVHQMLMEAKPLQREEADKKTHVLDLSDQTRKDLYAFWIESFRRELKEKGNQYEEKFNEATDKLQEVRNMETVEILKDSEIVGMTTTGAAKYRKILQIIRPQIIIVEEAAEVLESHIVTTLNENCQHLILIGDHKQLRPSTTVYALAKKYHMDISLFERMVCNGVPCVTLEEQHRMRPAISILLTDESLYPQLRDHPSVKRYEDIKGLEQNVQFITHEEEETSMTESTSYSNPHEAKYLAKLCRYLLNQGYHRDQISVITPYMGQVMLLRKEMPKSDFEGVRITAVDNFQGEENDIILLSLVRSRPFEDMPLKRNPIGFVGIENRICVSLSRAKKGFYVIGNFRLLEQYSEMWERMIRMMSQKGLVKEGLSLKCQNHPETVTFAQTVADFKKVPEGGCNLSCNEELPCGHVCPKDCHPVDRDHQNFLCTQPCEKIICSNNHKCTKHCYELCGQCNTAVQNVIPMCGHKASMPCHMDPYKWKCNKLCESRLPCGHPCNRKCSECTEEKHHEKECKVNLKRTLECGHQAQMKCHDDPSAIDCKIRCDSLLDCNHKCSGKCGLCFGGRIHQGCNSSCGTILPCGHKCSVPCSEICPPCTRQCEFECSHRNQCKNRCYEKCSPCFGPCKFNCQRHKIRCSLPCNEPCEIQPCTEPCNKKLKCKEGHGTCRGICGERCFCIICQEDKLRLDRGETIKANTVLIQLPNCNCILEIGKFRHFIDNMTAEGYSSSYKQCPYCSSAITKHIRPFTNLLKTSKETIVQKYEALHGSCDERKAKIKKLTKEFKKLQEKGLSKKDVEVVTKKLQMYNFGALHYADKVQTRLIVLMEIVALMEKSRSSVTTAVEHTEGIVKVSKLRDVLLRGRRFVTEQFWQEVDRELKRMRLWAKFYILNERLESKGKVSSDMADIITAVFQIISRKAFDQEAEQRMSEIYRSIASNVYQMRSFDLVEIKALLDDYMKDYAEVCDAQMELEAKVQEGSDGTPV